MLFWWFFWDFIVPRSNHCLALLFTQSVYVLQTKLTRLLQWFVKLNFQKGCWATYYHSIRLKNSMHGSVVLPIPFFHCPSFSCKSPLFHRSREREVSFFENSCLVFFSVVPFSWLKETLFARSCFHSPHARVPRSISLEEGRGGEHRQLTSLPITLLPPSRPLAKTKANTNTNT